MLWCMRTTFTVDDDATVLLEQARKKRNASLKEVVNEALRAGLQQLAAPPGRRLRFQNGAVDLGRVHVALELSAVADDLLSTLNCYNAAGRAVPHPSVKAAWVTTSRTGASSGLKLEYWISPRC